MRRLRLNDERGMALIIALGIMVVLALSLTAVVDYTTSNQRTSNLSKTRESAFQLADAGINNALAVLNDPSNNALDPNLLGSAGSPITSTYENGTVQWYGVLDRANAVWTVTATGSKRNPTGPSAGQVKRTLSAKISVTPTVTQPLNNPAWNYMFATRTGNACDETLNNNVSGGSRMYVLGNLCLNNNVALSPSVLIVDGNLSLANGAAVGASTSMSTRVETYVGGGCKYGSNVSNYDTPCPGDSDHIYSKKNPPSYVVGVNSTPPVIAAPQSDFAGWYMNAIPGPAQSCTATSGTPPTFDTNYPTRDDNVGVVDLTPASSYTCRVGPGASTTLSSAVTASATTVSVASASGFPTSGSYDIRIDNEVMTVTGGQGTTTWTVTRGAGGTTAASHVSGQTVNWNVSPSGELSWNATTKNLTVSGTLYIDGSAQINNGALNTYNGQAALYLSGYFYLNGKLCGGVSGSNCDFAAWNPNTEMLTIVANGSGSGNPVPTTDSIFLANNSSFQGALYATKDVDFGNNAYSDGPIVGSQIILSNNVSTQSFPTVTTVPAGMPGNPAVYAQPNPPQLFSG